MNRVVRTLFWSEHPLTFHHSLFLIEGILLWDKLEGLAFVEVACLDVHCFNPFVMFIVSHAKDFRACWKIGQSDLGGKAKGWNA